jgi:hypothetical protein
MRWYFKYNKWIHLEPVTSHHLLEYHFFNKIEDEIKLNGEAPRMMLDSQPVEPEE